MTKPRDYGKTESRRGQFFQGSQVQEVPKKVTVTYDDFRAGYDSSLGRDKGSENGSPRAQDVFVNHANRIKRLQGATDPIIITTAIPKEMTVQTSLQGTSEVIFFAPPAIQILGLGDIPIWYDLGIGDNHQSFRYALYGETLIFTNGFGVFTREPDQAGATASLTIPPGNSYAVFAARLMVAGATIDGEHQPMGIAWNTNDGDIHNFSGPTAGFELLISDKVYGDSAVAIRMMNLDLVGIVCKNSIWVGRRTQDQFRPAAFEPRVIGSGGLTDRTVAAGPLGIIYLAETGVRAFDGNSSILISDAINSDLLPLNLDLIADYKLTYDQRRNWLWLHTPVCTWIYDIERTRWYKSSLLATDSLIFKVQVAGMTWDEAQALGLTWDQVEDVPWSEYSRREIGPGRMMFLRVDGPAGFFFETEDINILGYGGVAMFPVWEFRHKSGEYANSMVTIDRIVIEYTGAGTIRMYLPDNTGKMIPVFKQVLAESGDREFTVVGISFIHSGKGAAGMVELIDGDIEIKKLQLLVDPRSVDPARPAAELEEYVDFWEHITP